jgi:Phage tail lysozyme
MLISFSEKAGNYGMRLMSELDINEIQASAILGNIGYLSNGAQPNYRDDDSYGPCWPKGTIGRGYGWAQWKNSSDGTNSLDSFIDFVKTVFGEDILTNSATDDQNYDYLVDELSNGNKAEALSALKTATTMEEATTIFMEKYENPNSFSIFLNIRLNYARQALACITGVDAPIRSTAKNLTETSV